MISPQEANALFPPYGRAIIARGQHEFNVYSTAGQHSQLRKFIQNLKKSLNITSTTAAEEKVIYKRVKRRICYHVEMWTKAGYLTGDRNHKSKTTMFDSLWRDQRSLWIQERDSGVQSNEDVEEGAAGGSIPPRSNEVCPISFSISYAAALTHISGLRLMVQQDLVLEDQWWEVRTKAATLPLLCRISQTQCQRNLQAIILLLSKRKPMYVSNIVSIQHQLHMLIKT
jgi:hypothetical protein